MAKRRNDYLNMFAQQLSSEVGRMRSLSINGGPVGWPASFEIHLPTGDTTLVDVYLGLVQPHVRQNYEYRFQGPANAENRALRLRSNVVPVILGIDVTSSPYVIVAGNTAKYIGKPERQTVLFNVNIIAQARTTGWAEYHSSTGEVIRAFLPEFLPLFVDLARLELDLPENEIRRTLRDAGHSPSQSQEERRRVVGALSRLIRYYRFSKEVVHAYGGRCALSDLNWGVVEAAHIYPVAALGSTDRICNGIGLTPTYHSLFDRHRIYIEPENFSVLLHPTLRDDSTHNAQEFINATRKELRMPSHSANRPDPGMLRQRYSYFGDAYSWAIQMSAG